MTIDSNQYIYSYKIHSSAQYNIHIPIGTATSSMTFRVAAHIVLLITFLLLLDVLSCFVESFPVVHVKTSRGYHGHHHLTPVPRRQRQCYIEDITTYLSDVFPIRRQGSVILHMSSSSSSSSSSDGVVADTGKRNVHVMVNGMPGPMATAAAEACLRKGLKLTPFAMTGPDIEKAVISVVDPQTQALANVLLIPSLEQDEIVAQLAGLREAWTGGGEDNVLVAIDYTHPSAVNSNAEFYVQHQIPFVMGTTGGDREQLMQTVQQQPAEQQQQEEETTSAPPPVAAAISCVIAPNMGKQIVAMQAALEELASKYPASFAGYTLTVKESHQKTKADTSGTAKAIIQSLNTLVGGSSSSNTAATTTTAFTNDDIQMI